MHRRLTIQLWVAVILTLSGIALLWAAFLVVPLGEIHNSVLLAFGEMSTFAGALFGIDNKDLNNKKTKTSDDEPAQD